VDLCLIDDALPRVGALAPILAGEGCRRCTAALRALLTPGLYVAFEHRRTGSLLVSL
jgi:hypothetical protein